MKLGIIGTGSIVNEFLPALITLEGLEILGILSTPRSMEQGAKLCKAYGIGCCTDDFAVLGKTGIDTIYVAVPNHLHYEYCRKGLENGLNVIVEKPMTANYEEAVSLRNMAREKQLFLFEAITTLYLGNYSKIREWLPRIGTVKLVQCQYSQYSRRYDAFREGKVLPAFDPAKSGGALMDLNLYNLHFVMGLFGKPQETLYFANMDRGIDTSGILILRYPSYLASCVAAKDSEGWRGSVIQGIDGCIRCDHSANYVGKVRLELNDGSVEEYDDQGYKKRVLPEFMAFMDVINRRDRKFCYDRLDESLQVSEILTVARRETGI